MPRIPAIVAAVILMISTFRVVNGQQIVNIKAAVLQFAEVEVFLDGKPVEFHDGIRIQVGESRRLDTQKGKVELLLPFYTYLRLGENSTLRVTGTRFNDMEMTLERGSSLIEVVEAPSGNRIRIQIGESVVAIEKEGLYRIDSDPGALRVHRGEATVTFKNKKVNVKSERMVPLAAVSEPKQFETDTCDPLHRWAAQRSFVLFIAPGVRSYKHWEPGGRGWLRHSGYGMRFYSEYFYWRYYVNRVQDELRALRLSQAFVSLRPSYNSATDNISITLDRELRRDRMRELSRELSKANEKMQLADPMTWKEDPDQSECD